MQVELNTISKILKPTPCSFVWTDSLLTESYLSKSSFYDLSLDTSIEEALAELSKEESFMVHLKVLKASETELQKHDFSKEKYLTSLGYGNLSLIETVSKFVDTLSYDFKEWALNKKLSPKDFRTFINDYKKAADEDAFDHIVSLTPTKSNGLSIFEHYFDLKALNKIDTDHIKTFKNAEKLMSSLKKKRFSNTLSKDEIVSKELAKLDLSKGVRIELKRLGDQRQIKLEIHSSSPEQLIVHLEKTSQKIDDISKAWSSNTV